VAGSRNKRTLEQSSPGIKQESISKITRAKRVHRVALLVEYLSSKCKNLTSTPSMEKNEKKKGQKYKNLI
jgi:hypothetical protein